MKLKLIFVFYVCALCPLMQAQSLDVIKVAAAERNIIRSPIIIPNVGNFKTLKCDFHTHTVFSDGSLTPEERVVEAVKCGLDVLAITEHIEYRPHGYIEADHNESVRIAKEVGNVMGLLVVQGAEITRDKPIGHLNALFIKDANKLDVLNPLDAIDNAVEQGAFIMWNHPGWPNDTTTLYPVHKKLMMEMKIHGIELVNGFEYYPKAFDFCKKYDLAYMGNSDIHGSYLSTFCQGYEPITIVFADECTENAVKEALFAHRTVVKFGDLLLGSEENLGRLITACLSFEVEKTEAGSSRIKLNNRSSLNLKLLFDNKLIDVPGLSYREFQVHEGESAKVINTYITSDTHLTFDFNCDKE